MERTDYSDEIDFDPDSNISPLEEDIYQEDKSGINPNTPTKEAITEEPNIAGIPLSEIPTSEELIAAKIIQPKAIKTIELLRFAVREVKSGRNLTIKSVQDHISKVFGNVTYSGAGSLYDRLLRKLQDHRNKVVKKKTKPALDSYPIAFENLITESKARYGEIPGEKAPKAEPKTAPEITLKNPPDQISKLLWHVFEEDKLSPNDASIIEALIKEKAYTKDRHVTIGQLRRAYPQINLWPEDDQRLFIIQRLNLINSKLNLSRTLLAKPYTFADKEADDIDMEDTKAPYLAIKDQDYSHVYFQLNLGSTENEIANDLGKFEKGVSEIKTTSHVISHIMQNQKEKMEVAIKLSTNEITPAVELSRHDAVLFKILFDSKKADAFKLLNLLDKIPSTDSNIKNLPELGEAIKRINSQISLWGFVISADGFNIKLAHYIKDADQMNLDTHIPDPDDKSEVGRAGRKQVRGPSRRGIKL